MSVLSDAPPVSVTITVNGEARDLSLDPRASLLDTLRLRLDLNGSKKGCNQGACGACTVLLDGERVNACLVLAVTCDGQQVTTIEGLGTPDDLSPIQDAFIEHDGFQCGYCTSGQILSGVALIDEVAQGQPSVVDVDGAPGSVADLSDEELSERMSGNICRCGAYPSIRAALRHAAQTSQPASA